MTGSTNPLTTRSLVTLAQQGNRHALEELFARSYPKLLQAARFRLGARLRARMDTLDLAQTAYFDAVRDLPRYSYRGKGSFQRWLLAIVENKIRKRLKSETAHKRDLRREVVLRSEADIPSPGQSPVTRLVDGEDRERLEEAVDRLPPLYRDVIVQRYYLNLSWRQVASALDRSEEAAQMLCVRALRQLKTLYRAGDSTAGPSA